jgi:hypothetical protein
MPEQIDDPLGMTPNQLSRWREQMAEPAYSTLTYEANIEPNIVDELFNAIEQVASGAAFRYSVPGVFVVSIQPDKNGQVWVENLKTCKQYQVVPV